MVVPMCQTCSSPSSFKNFVNTSPTNGFVRPSAALSLVGTNSSLILPSVTFSRIK